MPGALRHAGRRAALLLGVCGLVAAGGASTAAPYRPINATLGGETVVLTGHDLSIEQVVRVARLGARVALSPEARRRSADAYGLLLEAAAEGVPVYWFNRGSGAGRESQIFTGDPLSPDNKKFLEERQLRMFRRGAFAGLGPEVNAEEIVRAMLVVRANAMTYEAASPQLTQRLQDLLNDRVTPVVYSRGTVGEGDLGPFSNVAAAMVGAGEVYYRGERMPAAAALQRAGLEPLAPFGADDSALISSDAYATGQAALVLFDGREALSWADLTDAIDLDAMNSSVSPLSKPVQDNRPFTWLNWDAARLLGMLKGGYLFQLDEQRIIQDPESLRASSIRQGAAWQAWAALRDAVLIQMNSSDHNPAVRVGAAPGDSWELATPQLAQFYVKGGPRSNGQHGYILSNANWDPYPMANDIEAFTIALANMDVVIAQRLNRFTSTFFTVMAPPATHGEAARWSASFDGGFNGSALMQEIQGLINPVPPEGNALVQNVEDLQAQTRLKVMRARSVVDDTVDLLAEDLLNGTFWLDLRLHQNPARSFGPAPTAVWRAFRAALPVDGDGAVPDAARPDAARPDAARPGAARPGPAVPFHELAAAFIREHTARTYYPENDREPGVQDQRKITR